MNTNADGAELCLDKVEKLADGQRHVTSSDVDVAPSGGVGWTPTVT